MSRHAKSSTLQPKIAVLDLIKYRNYAFAWFSEIAIKLCTGRNLEELNQNNISSILSDVAKCSNDLINKMHKTNKDPCTSSPIPLTGNDPKGKMNLCYANTVLNNLLSMSKIESLPLPPALSLEFAEFTRSFMGIGREKRNVFVIAEDVLALSIIGARLTQSYVANREYGYVYVEVVPYILSLDKLRDLNSLAKRITEKVQKNEGSINVVFIGIATAISIVAKEFLRDILKLDGHTIANYLRIARTGNKIMVKGFDSIDLVHLAKIVKAGGIAGALYSILNRYPSKEYNSLRRFIELVATNLIKYQSFRKPQYIYEILRYLTSPELNTEGVEWYTKKNTRGLDWSEIVERFTSLSRLIN
uniref:Uncharacterized protein n=1 Tax=Ignisphaera aggregans TaxID=334771 RepID=A0A7J3MXE0_9CREN